MNVPTPPSTPLTLYKRWMLRDAVSADAVQRFVEQRIVPAYRRLSPEVELGFEVVRVGDDEAATSVIEVIAVQRWSSRAAHAGVTSGDGYARWWAEYEPTLVEWDRLVVFVDEWATTPVELRGA